MSTFVLPDEHDYPSRVGALVGLAAQLVALGDVAEHDSVGWPETWTLEQLRRIVARLREQPGVLDEAARYREHFAAQLRIERRAWEAR